MFGMCTQCQKSVVGFTRKASVLRFPNIHPLSPFSENAEYNYWFKSKREEHFGHQAAAVRFPTVFHWRYIGLQMLS